MEGTGGVAGVDLDRVIGRGASSIVFLGTQHRFERQVAVKILDLPGQDDLGRSLFLNECRTLGRLTSHPNIVTLFDAGFDDSGRPYLVMEYLPAGNLATQVAEDGPLEVAEVLRIGVQLAGALATTHLHDIVHGDVKPQNVLRTRTGEAALSDFGIARLTTAANATTRAPLMTPLHAAPELFDGGERTPLSDVYELCSTLFTLLDGEPAVGGDGDSPLIIVGRVYRGERRHLDPERFPAPVVEIIEEGLAREPGDRPCSATVLGERLQQAQRDLGLDPTPLVVIDQLPPDDPEAMPGDALAGVSLTPLPSAVAGDGQAAMTMPPPDAPDPDRAHRRGRLMGSLVALVLLLGGVAWWAAARDEPDRADTAVQGAKQSQQGTTVPGTLPGRAEAGVQPDVTYDVPGASDQSSVLAARLGQPAGLLAPLGSGIVGVDYPSYLVQKLPATIRYEAFNPKRVPTCAGLITPPITVTGLWEKAATWPGHQAIVRVLQFSTPAEAASAFTAFSVEQGPRAGDCTGFTDDINRTDATRAQVSHRQPPLSLAEGVPYNSFVGPPPAGVAGFQTVTSVVARYGDTLVLLSVASADDVADPAAVSAVLEGIGTRLGD